jgi:perosamine synthetase
MNSEGEDMIIGAWMPTAVFEPQTGVSREALQAAFAAADIDARVFFHPLSSLPMFEAQRGNSFAWDIPGRAINLPSFHDMTQLQQARVVDVLQSCLEKAS